MSSSRRKNTPDWLTFLSAVFLVFAYPPWGFSPLIWIALVPWFSALKRARSYRDAFVQGIWLSFFMSVGGLYWVAYVLHEFADLPWAVAAIGLLLYAIWGQSQFLVFAPLYKWLQNRLERSPGSERWDRGARSLGVAVVFASLYTGLDWAIPKLFTDTLGHALYESVYLRQAADLGGVYFLSFVIYIVNDLVAQLLRRLRARREPSYWPALQASAPELFFALALLAGTTVYGIRRNGEIRALLAASPRSVQAGVIQANIGDFEKFASETGIGGAANHILDRFFSLSDEALAMTPKPDFIVWPETSYPSTFRTPQTAEELARDQRVERFVAERKVPLLFGGYDHQGTQEYNAFFLLSPNGTEGDLQTYRKRMLLLFGEYIPGADTFDFIKNAFPQVGNFGRGKGPEVYSLPLEENKSAPVVKVGPVICYEALFPSYVIEAARMGSQLILNITNDSWFGPRGEPQLHFALITFRSIETRLPQLRSTNTGISALILPDGTVQAQTAIDRPEIMNVRIPVIEPVWTLMKAWGDWFGGFALAMGFLGGIWLLKAAGRHAQ